MNEQDIPIEITASKLLDWLESRKIVPKHWKIQIRNVRTKISVALNDMPEHQDLVKLLSGEYINYFHCLQIVDILKTTEKDTRSLFGRYGSQRMTDWQQIVKSYEKDTIYLAEAAQIYQRNNTEVPSLRRQRTKIGQLMDDAQQKIKDLLKSEENVIAERMVICQQLGIKGIYLKEEFTERVKELPKLYEALAKKIPTLRKAIQLYLEFAGNSELLPLVRHIESKGNTTVYEYVYNEAPVSIEEAPIMIKLSLENDVHPVNNEIDFGDAIDFGGNDSGDGIIDFGDVDIADISVEPSSIDWGIDVSGVQAEIGTISLGESGIVVAPSDNDGKVARGEEAYTVLDSTTHRDQFIDELYELESFLLMRQYELSSDQSNSFVFSIIEGNSKHDLNDVEIMLQKVQLVIGEASSDIIDHLHRLKHSPLYADILAGKLRQHLLTAEKMTATRTVLKEKIEALTKERANLRPVIIKLIEKNKILQKQIENEISKRYKGRIVYIYGGVEADPMD